MWRVDLEVDRLPVDAFVVSCYPRGFVLDFAFNLGEVVEPPPGNVQKLSPFLLASYARGGMWNVNLIVIVFIALAGKVDELKDKRPTCYDAAASGEKVSADNILEHRGFSRRL